MNYKHLEYFKEVAELGSIARASEKLHLTPQTISGQIQLLEQRFGTELFIKRGRNLALTETGRMVLEYAREIFGMGAELKARLRQEMDGSGGRRAMEFRVGVADAIHKSIVYRLIEPALHIDEPVRLVCREWRLEQLLAELALHHIDVVLADAPAPTRVPVRAHSRLLGSTSLAVFATPALRKRHPARFPRCLDGAPILLPGGDSTARPKVQGWLQDAGLAPRLVGDFDDPSLAQEFARHDAGFVVAPAALAADLARHAGLRMVGTVPEVRQEYWAISVERRIANPCVLAIMKSAQLFLEDVPSAGKRGSIVNAVARTSLRRPG